jgi:hypothetical protein
LLPATADPAAPTAAAPTTAEIAMSPSQNL